MLTVQLQTVHILMPPYTQMTSVLVLDSAIKHFQYLCKHELYNFTTIYWYL